MQKVGGNSTTRARLHMMDCWRSALLSGLWKHFKAVRLMSCRGWWCGSSDGRTMMLCRVRQCTICCWIVKFFYTRWRSASVVLSLLDSSFEIGKPRSCALSLSPPPISPKELRCKHGIELMLTRDEGVPDGSEGGVYAELWWGADLKDDAGWLRGEEHVSFCRSKEAHGEQPSSLDLGSSALTLWPLVSAVSHDVHRVPESQLLELSSHHHPLRSQTMPNF